MSTDSNPGPDPKKRKCQNSVDQKVEFWKPKDEGPYFNTLGDFDLSVSMTNFCYPETCQIGAEIGFQNDEDCFCAFDEDMFEKPIDERIGDRSIVLSLPSKNEDESPKMVVLSPSNGRIITFRYSWVS